MQHCTKHHKNNSGFYYNGHPPPLTFPRKCFSYADTNRTGFVCQQNIINAVSANLRPMCHYQKRFIRKKITDIFQLCNINSCDKIKIEMFLYLKIDRRLIQLEQEYRKTFRPIHRKVQKLRVVNNTGDRHGSENFVAPRALKTGY